MTSGTANAVSEERLAMLLRKLEATGDGGYVNHLDEMADALRELQRLRAERRLAGQEGELPDDALAASHSKLMEALEGVCDALEGQSNLEAPEYKALKKARGTLTRAKEIA